MPPKSYVIEVRLDARMAASLLHHYTSRGVPITTKSGLVNACLTDMIEILRKNKMIQEYTDTSSALEYLKMMGLTSTRASQKQISEQIQREAIILDPSQIPLPQDVEEQVEELRRRMSEPTEEEAEHAK